MTMRPRHVVLAATAIAGLALGGAALAGATSGDDHDRPIPGSALDRASRTAVDHTGGGRVTATEVGDVEGYYEVEVTRADGSQLDVHLDRGFEVLGSAGDRESEPDDRD